jgi:acyl-coenzyme A synthetase/AMP-(fatty) acid ligase
MYIHVYIYIYVCMYTGPSVMKVSSIVKFARRLATQKYRNTHFIVAGLEDEVFICIYLHFYMYVHTYMCYIYIYIEIDICEYNLKLPKYSFYRSWIRR